MDRDFIILFIRYTELEKIRVITSKNGKEYMSVFIEIISRLIGLGLVVFIAGMSIYLTFYILPFFLLFLAIVYIIKIIKEKIQYLSIRTWS